MAREATCPRCGTRREWSGNPWRPFCSERCKLIDLGGWLSEKNAIAGESADVVEGDAPLQRKDRDH
ncbi:MAG TPA: DNA gyrase inhibitor YacG [Steroidobacteraceae bacterium]|nr:DNA gyrase inhibitor YacG [Steroidobacteraceae bacterium]